ncbi:hypothetical protein MAR_008275 [Mya arenaria]|uniref:NTR domain-containing protein n=1 Tax=Mya arenaria TaxID=6604 RepID=A0ABY7DVK2_MYAAR|nr:uncharacterized protein LOC128229635 [Mya arenaria]WAR01717.1 hypothetical protein MAR_008275 [Mya arenaria]
MFAYRFILLLIIVILYLRISAGCRCSIIGEEARFCYAKFAIIGTVIKERRPDTEKIVYTVLVQQTVKPVQIHSVKQIEVHTSSVSSMCGAQLEVGKTYLLAGGLHKGVHSLSVCHIGREMTHLEAQNYVAPTCSIKKKVKKHFV